MENTNKINYWFTADQHMGHYRILQYCNRPWKTVEEMDNAIIKNHNEVVGVGDVVYHLGDFTLIKEYPQKYINRLNGEHIFIQGGHDYWMKEGKYDQIKEIKIEGQNIVLCHYAMRIWPKSHYNSWHLFGHSHGRLEAIGKSLDVGVDTHNFFPYSFDEIKQIMKLKNDNINKLKE